AGDSAIEDRSKLGIGADPGIELIHQAPDSILGNMIDLHDRLRHILGATATTTIAIHSSGLTGYQRASEVPLAKEKARRIAPLKQARRTPYARGNMYRPYILHRLL